MRVRAGLLEVRLMPVEEGSSSRGELIYDSIWFIAHDSKSRNAKARKNGRMEKSRGDMVTIWGV